MGKSAGKWIKTVLFGKKHSKSSLSKHVTPDKKTPVKSPLEDQAANPPVISEPVQFSERGTDSFELEKESSGSPCDGTALALGNQGNDSLSFVPSDQVTDAEMIRQEQAATKAQAAFRGYLARRAFRALKGIIRLQALIRGHLVRRQAVATLRCMRAIVQFQALARGRKARLLVARIGVLEKFKDQDATPVNSGLIWFRGTEKLTTNAFVRKLVVAVPNPLPLALQYDITEPNSAWNWLERWSLSHFWEPPLRTKKNVKAKSQRKQTTDVETVKSKRTIRKGLINGDNGVLGSFESDKLKRNPRKPVNSNPTESAQDQPQTELERVKRNLRKVSASAAEKSETLPEKPQPIQSVEIAVTSLPSVVSEQEIVISSENLEKSDDVVDKLVSPEISLETKEHDEPMNTSYETPIESHSLVENGVKVESEPTFEDDCKEESSGKEYQKIRKRNSLPAKHEYAENISQNSPALPSYMAATESAKAKLRATGSSKLSEDGVEQQGFVRRHSLPALSNGKLSSLSPRIQKPTTQSNGKKGSRTNRSLTTSRDDKVLQPGWRR